MSIRPAFHGGAGSSNSPPSTPPPSAAPPRIGDFDPDFVVILAALLCAVICALALAALAHCAWIRRISGRDAAASPPHANKGLKKKILKSLPKVRFSPELAAEFSECAICLADFAAGDELRVLPQCGHGFHAGCVDTWLGSHSSCPSCRQLLVPPRCQKGGESPAATCSPVDYLADTRFAPNSVYHSSI
ncbi:unnamed protein product [Cuscuta campestris]|uniref:RING-type domain-containing protein n=1 Tax=Cuscuta campestris TaxID=132261 RepID=A0A484L573_9ASTE|nr:unnamed protein product [Cuscuta campestris]